MEKVFISRRIPNRAIETLKSAGLEVKVWGSAIPPTQEELAEHTALADALICMLSDNINKDFLLKNKHLKVITNYAVGFNNIDIGAATELGIPIGNTPDVLSEATADHAFTLMLAVARKILDSNRSIGEGKWKNWEPMGFLGQDLRGRTLGIVGMGRIGQEFSRLCHQAFGMKILYFSNTAKPEIDKKFGAKKVDFDELLAQSDVISVHTSLNEGTKGIFDKKAFRQMKKSAIFINTARGEIHQEADLIEALSAGEIWGAGLDVSNPEPMSSESPLLTLPNAIVTPHIASATIDTRANMAFIAAQNVIKGLKNEKLLGFVNPIVHTKV
ncbi:MAG: D-glycerate dehydrogenase [Cytophagales bacterium]|nr:MAG: D-glycerate dehydrogenase [Cytophagales bacterium]